MEEEGLHGEVLTPLARLQPLEVFPKHDIVLTAKCACVCMIVCVCGYVHITTPLHVHVHHIHVPLHEVLELSRLVDLVCAVRYVAVKLVLSLL